MMLWVSRARNLKYQLGKDDLKVEIEKLDRKLRRIQATIEEVEHRENHNETVKLWLQELKCLASDAEDVLDVYNYELLREDLEVKLDVKTLVSDKGAGIVYNFEPSITIVNCVSSCFSKSIIVEIIENIRQINSRFEEISRDKEALRLTNEEGKRRDGTDSINFSATSHLMNIDGIFGRIGDKKKIIDFLLWDGERNDQFRVIPILGMGGIGKTTLAQMVYDDPSVKSMFDVRAWVYVSPEFDIIRLTKDISEIVTGNAGNSFHGFSKIQEMLQEELIGKTMLLVLDDVWNVQPNDWAVYFLPFRVAKLVRVLVTSRSDAVVQELNTVTTHQLSVTPHWLNVLSEDECQKLLYHCAISGENMNKEICSVDIDRQIIKKCGRLPLAIKCIGGVLRYNNSKDSWMKILDSEFWESDEFEPVFQALKVSYYHLPRKLRACFLFCSLFPKGSRLRKISIIYMWMAHGFLQPIGRKRAEDLGEDYLDELQMRSFIVPCTKSSFCLHDVIYDLARSLSAGEIHTIMNEKSNHIPDNIQHLYIKNGHDFSQCFGPCRLRTLFNATPKIPGNFTGLHDITSVRVLGLIGSNVFALTDVPLKHLRYLAITGFNGETLPESLCLLYHLETLNITHCCHLRDLPINIANLVNLRYLHITHVGIQKLPVALWQVHNLQILCLKECWNFRILPIGISDLMNLYILKLKSCKQLEELPADIGHLTNLRLLDLSFSGIKTLPVSIGILILNKLAVVGVPGSIRKQLNSDLMHLIIAPEDIKRMGLPVYDDQSHVRDKYDVKEISNNLRKLIILRPQQWQSRQAHENKNPATVAEDIDSAGRNTWMSSHDSTPESVI